MHFASAGATHVRAAILAPAALAALVFSGCAGRGPAEVSPAEIPELEARVAERPDDGALVLRYAAALFAAERCDTASTVAARGARLDPSNAIAPLVIGQCQERADRYDDAIATYSSFLADNEDGRGAGAVRAREMFARRLQASAQARQALQQEQQLAGQPADPQTVAVLPLEIAGDTAYQPLSRGLAQIIASDLALLQRFRMVERMQIGALLDELQLGQDARVDGATAARVGRLVRAGRLVQGVAAIPPDENVRLEASVVLASGEVSDAESVSGRLRDLMRIEKDLVVALAGQLGYTLSEAERRAVLENGTQNLAAFLAYSRGLVAEDLGDFSRAAAYFSQAVQADPNFQQARQQYQASSAAPGVQQASAGQVTTVARGRTSQPATTATPVSAAIATVVVDVAATQAEQTEPTAGQQTTQQATTTPTSDPPPTVVDQELTTASVGTINIIFRLP